jgi:hypothetical protein
MNLLPRVQVSNGFEKLKVVASDVITITGVMSITLALLLLKR